MTKEQRAKLMKLVAAYRGKVNAVYGYEDEILYFLDIPSFGTVVYNEDDREYSVEQREASFTEGDFAKLDRFLLGCSREIIEYIEGVAIEHRTAVLRGVDS